MTPDVAKRVIEGALLCANRPLAINDIRQLFDEETEVSPDTVQSLLDELRQDWHGRSVELVPLASGWRFQCAADVARHVLRLQPERIPRYSRAVMETLAIIAYHQPVTRGDIEEIRGVGVSAHIIKTLEDRGWIDQVGVKEVPGRPALFATTRQFLDDLNLRSLKELPQLDDGLPNQNLLELAGTVAPEFDAAVVIAGAGAPAAAGAAEPETAGDEITTGEIGAREVGSGEIGAASAEAAVEAGPAAAAVETDGSDADVFERQVEMAPLAEASEAEASEAEASTAEASTADEPETESPMIGDRNEVGVEADVDVAAAAREEEGGVSFDEPMLAQAEVVDEVLEEGDRSGAHASPQTVGTEPGAETAQPGSDGSTAPVQSPTGSAAVDDDGR